jgi:hypothetical protein
MMVIIKKFPVALHQLFFFVAQLLILKVHGIEYSGSLAYIGAVSTIFAVVISLRWDIEIMVSKLQTLPDCLLDASMTIILMSVVISLVNHMIGQPVPIHIILSGLIIAVHELLVAILFVQKKIYRYSFARSIPAILLVYLSTIGYGPEIIWPISFLVSALFMFFHFGNLFKESILLINLNRFRSITFSRNLYATLSASLFTFFSGFFVIIISYFLDDGYVGLWSNTLRIFNSVFIFVLGACLPFLLISYRDQLMISGKIKRFFYFWALFFPFILLFFLVVKTYGMFILSQFTDFDIGLKGIHLSQIFLVGICISFVGSAQGLYQSINKSLILFFMIMITMAIGAPLILKASVSFIIFLNIFLFLTLALTGMVLAHLIYCMIFNSKEFKI